MTFVHTCTCKTFLFFEAKQLSGGEGCEVAMVTGPHPWLSIKEIIQVWGQSTIADREAFGPSMYKATFGQRCKIF